LGVPPEKNSRTPQIQNFKLKRRSPPPTAQAAAAVTTLSFDIQTT